MDISDWAGLAKTYKDIIEKDAPRNSALKRRNRLMVMKIKNLAVVIGRRGGLDTLPLDTEVLEAIKMLLDVIQISKSELNRLINKYHK